MGILNRTPDSFSDGGRFSALAEALAHAERMVEAGADLIDVGGESTRPGAPPVSEREELRRVLPLIEALARRLPVPLSIDTYKAEVARAAIDAGAAMVNDISGLRFDPAMAPLIAKSGVTFCAMHLSGSTPSAMHQPLPEGDALSLVVRDLQATFDRAVGAGIRREQLVLDPGLGFGKSTPQNLALLRGIASLKKTCGLPVLIGASRKRFVGELSGRSLAARENADAAICALCAERGADILRVHDVAAAVDAVRVAAAFCDGGAPADGEA